MVATLGKGAPSYSRVKKWAAEFKYIQNYLLISSVSPSASSFLLFIPLVSFTKSYFYSSPCSVPFLYRSLCFFSLYAFVSSSPLYFSLPPPLTLSLSFCLFSSLYLHGCFPPPPLNILIPSSLLSSSVSDVTSEAPIILLSINIPSYLLLLNRGLSLCSPHLPSIC